MAVVGETRIIGPWQKLKDSFVGILFGLIFLPAAFLVVYVASKREQASVAFRGALPVAHADQALAQHRAVFATGSLDSAPLGDPQFVKPGRYLSLYRTAEEYAWKQKKETRKEQDGNTTRETDVYDCTLTWTSSPDADVGSKQGCEGKSNPAPRYASERLLPSWVTVAANGTAYRVNPLTLDPVSMPGARIAQPDLLSPMTQSGGAYYPDASCGQSPRLGCERIRFAGTSYQAGATYTVIGAYLNGQFEEYRTGRGGLLAGSWLKVGPGNFNQTLRDIARADAWWTLVWYGASVICFWLGLVLLTGPILLLIDFIPIIGGLGRGLITISFFLFSLLVMGLSFLIIEYFWIIMIALLALAAFLLFRRQKAAAR